MDKATLVNSELDQARRTVKALAAAGLPIYIALALCDMSSRPWTLLIASPNVVKHGPAQAIRFADQILQAGDTPYTIDDLFLVGPNDSRAKRAIGYLDNNLRHRVDDRPSQITLQLDDNGPQRSFVLAFDPRAKASDISPVANETAIHKAWAA